jgi:hypothetical protein
MIEIGVVNAQLCVGKPKESRQSELYISGYVCCIMSFVAIILRCYYRYAFTNSIGHDDWTIIAAGLVLTGVLTTDLLSMSGLGLKEIQTDASMQTFHMGLGHIIGT